MSRGRRGVRGGDDEDGERRRRTSGVILAQEPMDWRQWTSSMVMAGMGSPGVTAITATVE